jgi:UPF0755 protein
MSQLVPFLTSDPLPPSRNDRSVLGRIAAAMGILGLLVAVVWGVSSVRGLVPDEQAAVTPGLPAVVVIETGDSLTRVGERLVSAEVVSSVSAFLAAVELGDEAVSIGPGVYNLVTGLEASEAITMMLDPASRAAPLVLPEGLRLADTIRLTSEHTGLPEAPLRAALLDSEGLGLPGWAQGRPEGFLFPASYDVIPGSSAEVVLATMVNRFDVMADEVNLRKRADRSPFSAYEILTIASLVQAEGTPEDFRKIARVAYNRLESGLPLQFDSTVNYALGTSTLLVTEDMLEVDSPYNTYRNTGLPPTPINSPGQEAIEAALRPAQGDWLYFVTVDPQTKETKFTASYEEFLVLKAQFQENYAEQAESSTP